MKAAVPAANFDALGCCSIISTLLLYFESEIFSSPYDHPASFLLIRSLELDYIDLSITGTAAGQ